ncbi:hypothetical protein [Nocardia sp. CY41]|nr:hypothetical protein [Nocardia sp. CY41]
MREKWFERVESTQERTGFQMRVIPHAPSCLCSHCHAEKFERAAEEEL